MDSAIKWAYLPWLDQGRAGTVCWICLVCGVIFALTTQLLRHTRAGYDLHAAPFLTVEAYGYALAVNTALFSLFYWYVALSVGFCFALAFGCAVRGQQTKIYYDEKNGKWGLSPALREVRGELFSDLSVEEQLATKQRVDAAFRKLNLWIYFAATLVLPFAVMLIMYACNMGYLFVPQALK